MWTFDDVMPFTILAAFALAGWLLHRFGSRRRAAEAGRSGDGGEASSAAWFAGPDGGGDCGGDGDGCD